MKVIGQVLARRCLECGLLEVHSDYDKEKASQKVNILSLGVCAKHFIPVSRLGTHLS